MGESTFPPAQGGYNVVWSESQWLESCSRSLLNDEVSLDDPAVGLPFSSSLGVVRFARFAVFVL